MKWNQQTIHAWGIATFGIAAEDSLGLAIRMAKEGVELSWTLRCGDDEEVPKETADTAIVLLQVANCIGFDLHQSLEEDQEYSDHDLITLFDSESEQITDSSHAAELLNQYIVDLISAMFHHEYDEAKKYIVRIMAVLTEIELMFEFELLDKIQEKMDINEKRQWAKAADGSFQHV